jgi:very-short-patch-repair endonuclease
MLKTHNNKIFLERRRELRRNQTLPEARLWELLRGKGVKNYKFRRQHSIGAYIADFYCPSAKLVVEIDGDSHQSLNAKEYDNVREKYMEALDIVTIRFSNEEVLSDIDSVIKNIESYLP